MIDLAILGLLLERDFHGYELKKRLGELLGPWSSMSYGSLYPALARLEKAAAVRVADATTLDEPSTPMTGALSGELAAFRRRGTRPSARGRRGKKVYKITTAGQLRFHDLMVSGGSNDDRSFALRVAFCRHLHANERLTLFEQRKAELTSQLANRRSPSERDLYLRSLRERDTRTIVNDLVWLDELIGAASLDLAGVAAATHGRADQTHSGDPATLNGGIHS